MGDRARTVVILVITIVWALNFIATAALPDFKAPPEINSIFMGTVGAVLATAPIGGRRREERRREDPPGGDGRPRSQGDETGDQQ